MENRIDHLFATKSKEVFSVYFTAGYPELDSTVPLIQALDKKGVDLIEIGIPFSDPLADGPVIQNSSAKAIANGMNLTLLFQQLKNIRQTTNIPLVLMGYFNTIMQFGEEAFCGRCEDIGIDGIIVPDMPLQYFSDQLQRLWAKYNLANIMLICPQTSDERIRHIDALSTGFVYMVSTNCITGANKSLEAQLPYFHRTEQMNLKNPRLVGFGIHDSHTFQIATKHANGAIIGSAFIKTLSSGTHLKENITEFIETIRS